MAYGLWFMLSTNIESQLQNAINTDNSCDNAARITHRTLCVWKRQASEPNMHNAYINKQISMWF